MSMLKMSAVLVMIGGLAAFGSRQDAPAPRDAADETLAVSILGPTVVPRDVECTWVADASGGTGPYQYKWKTLFTQTSYSSSDSYSVAFSTANDIVIVTVRDANLNTAADTIAVNANGSSC